VTKELQVKEPLKSPKEIIAFARRTVSSLSKEIWDKNKELEAWQSVLDLLKPCDECEAKGSFRVFVASDETEIKVCDKCKGTGSLA